MTLFKQGEAPITGSFELCPKCGGFVKLGEQCPKCFAPKPESEKKEASDAVDNCQREDHES